MTFILLPTQLFENIKLINNVGVKTVILIEHPLYFKKYNYHVAKLILHRATLKKYFDYLEAKLTVKINYVEFHEYSTNKLSDYIKNDVHMYDPIDHDILKEYRDMCKKNKLTMHLYDSPNFICSQQDLQEYVNEKNLFMHSSFYIWCRKRFGILLDDKEKPLGGKWSFDKDNRSPFPKSTVAEPEPKKVKNSYVTEAIEYVKTHFAENIGDPVCYLPIDHSGAKKHLSKFINTKLECFGPYQDAVGENITFGCHSVLSPLINIGLLNPKFIIDEVTEYISSNKVNYASVEGFVRQLFWREYVRFVYVFKFNELKANYFGHTNKLNKSWYTGKTNIPPIDSAISKFIKYGYLHHIERLMYVGNFMMLTNIDPKFVFNWFMMFIDAYPWVMYPNVYGMSQHASGQLMMKRPYFSSSNYIDKMSSFKKKKNVHPKINLGSIQYEWFEIWDALYYKFVSDNYDYLNKNYSTANIASVWNKKSKSDQKNIIKIANMYLNKY